MFVIVRISVISIHTHCIASIRACVLYLGTYMYVPEILFKQLREKKHPKKKVLKIQVATRNLFEDKRSPQEGPKSAQNEAKRAPEESKEHLYIPNLDFIKNATFSAIISRFLRVRGPA